MKECKICNGTGIIMSNKGITQCKNCAGTGVPLYDEDYNNAQTLLGEEYYGEDEDD